MSSLTTALDKFKQAQQELYAHLGVTRRDDKGRHISVPALCYTHGNGNQDIPTAYPEVLDYRAKGWQITETDTNSDEEIHVMMDSSREWEPENIVRFSILSIWDTEEDGGTVFAAASHLPKPNELHYERADEVEGVEAGNNFHGDTCILILNPRLGESLLDDYKDYVKE